jgi:hypothetical protein
MDVPVYAIELPSSGHHTPILSMLEAIGAEYVRVNRARSGALKRRLVVTRIVVEMAEVDPTDAQKAALRSAQAMTGYVQQPSFMSPADVHAFFGKAAAEARGVAGGISQEDLDRFADAVIATRSNCDF